MSRAHAGRTALAAHLLVLALGLLPLWSAHLFGWIPADEGYLNSAAVRFAAGEVPHRDYVERFPGALPAWNAAARALFGESFAGPRRGLLLAAVLLLVLIHVVARQNLATPTAALVALAVSTWGVPRWFASNPTWYVVLFGVAAAVLLQASINGRRPGLLLLLAGVCGGVAISFKQTAGAYVVAALFAASALDSVERANDGEKPAGVLDRLAAISSALLLPALLAVALSRQGGLYYPLLLVVVPAAIGLSVAARAVPGRVRPGTMAVALWVSAGVLLGTAPLVIYYAAHGALAQAARGIFPAQWDAAMRQMLPYFGLPLGPPVLRLLVWIGSGALAGAAPRTLARWAPLPALLHAGVAAAVAAEGDAHATVVFAAREVIMFAPLGIGAAAAMLAARGVRLGNAGVLALLTAACFGVVYPLGAFLYAYYVAPLAILTAAVLARRAYPAPLVAGAALLAIAVALTSPTGAKQSDGRPRPDRTTVVLPGAGGNLRVPAVEGRAVLRIVAEIRRRVGPGAAVFSYPSDFGFNLLSDTVNPTPHLFVDYYADADDFRTILETLDRRKVRLVVLRTYMPVNNPYRASFLEALDLRYRPVANEPPFLLLERFDQR